MIQDINDLLFHPSTIIKYKDTRLYKALLYIFIIAFISSLYLIMSVIKFPGANISHKTDIEKYFDLNFKSAATLPNCSLNNYELTCDNNDEVYLLGKGLIKYTFVIDVNENLENLHEKNYIILTKNNIKITSKYSIYYVSYKSLPSKWQSFDFKTIKEQKDPDKALYNLFIDGINQMFSAIKPILVIGIYVLFCFSSIFLTLFFSLLFYLLYRRYNYSFKEIFKITTFAQTFPVIVGLIINLLGFSDVIIITTLIFIYIYIAIISNVDLENKLI